MWIDILLGIFVLIAIICIWILIYDGNRFAKVEYTFTDERFLEDAVFVVLADLHGKSYGVHNEKLIAAIDEINPDGVLIAGDMINAEKGKGYEEAYLLIEALAKKYPVFYGNGNHEYRTYFYTDTYDNMFEEYKTKLEKCGVHYLLNASMLLPKCGAYIYGIDMERYFYQRFYKRPMTAEYMNKTLGEVKKERPTVLLAHNPIYFEEYADWGADLVLSGHIHGGMVRLPFLGGMVSPMVQFFPHYDGGEFKEFGKTMILSRGLGMHTLPIRFLNPGELVVVHMKKGN